MNLKVLLVKGARFVLSQDRTILTGCAVAGTIVAVASAWKARPKCEEILEQLNEDGASNLEKAKALAPVLAPVVLSTAASVGCALLSHRRATQKIGALISAYSTAKTAMDIRKEVEKELLPPEQVQEIDNQAALRAIEQTPVDRIHDTGHGEYLFYEPMTGAVFKSDPNYIKLQVKNAAEPLMRAHCGHMLLDEDVQVSMNDLFEALGWDDAKGMFGGMFGWPSDTYDEIRPNLNNSVIYNGKPAYVLDFYDKPVLLASGYGHVGRM